MNNQSSNKVFKFKIFLQWIEMGKKEMYFCQKKGAEFYERSSSTKCRQPV